LELIYIAAAVAFLLPMY